MDRRKIGTDDAVFMQQVKRTDAGLSPAHLDLARLFRDVYMNDARKVCKNPPPFRRDGPYRVRSQPDRKRAASFLREPNHGFQGFVGRGTPKPALFFAERNADPPSPVGNPQQYKPNAYILRGRRDCQRKFIGILVRVPGRLMVQVVELAHGRHAGLEHLQKRQPGNLENALWVQAVGHAVHGLPPPPEVVRTRTTTLNMPAKRTLKGMRMGVYHPGDDNPPRQAGHLSRGDSLARLGGTT
jgi:hypothetical protein